MKTVKNIHIGIDGNEANIANRVGSNVFAWELLQAMYAFLQREPLFSVTVYLSGPRIEGWPSEKKWWKYRIIPPAKLWTQWRLPLELYTQRDIDLFFSPGHYLPRWSPVPVIPTIMDVAYEFFPEFFRRKDYLQLRTWTERSVRQAKHIFTISESTKRDVVQRYSRLESDITVIYPAVKKVKKLSSAEVSAQLTQMGVTEPYIVYIGTLQPRKNIERLVGAFEQVVAKGWPGSLVLAGKVGWLGEAIDARIQSSPLRHKIIQTGFVTEMKKNALIQGAECSVLVGMYEGFGIPPLESILLGTMPVVSSTSSLPEVVGAGGMFADPNNQDDIARVIGEVVGLTRVEREKRLGQMIAHTSQFSWEASAEKACHTLANLVKGTHVL